MYIGGFTGCFYCIKWLFFYLKDFTCLPEICVRCLMVLIRVVVVVVIVFLHAWMLIYIKSSFDGVISYNQAIHAYLIAKGKRLVLGKE